MIESIYVVTLFVLFSIQWEVKRRLQKRSTGIDPDVFARAATPLQRYMNGMSLTLTALVVVLIALHAWGIQYYSLFSRFDQLGNACFDHLGFALGVSGLGLCLHAQYSMGASWRVGIDEEHRTELVTGGIYGHVRNPTYLGIFILLSGIWIIWPTWTIALFALTFVLFLEIQVRCEEEFLLRGHGKAYGDYMARTKRYLPGVY